MTLTAKLPFDGLLLDENTLSWHISVRCRSGFNGQVPLPEELVPGADAVDAVSKAMLNSNNNVVALVGGSGTGKTTVIGWLLEQVKNNSSGVKIEAFKCSSRTFEELSEFLSFQASLNTPKWIVIDGLDELRGNIPFTIDGILKPILHRLIDGSLRVLFSVRDETGKVFLEPPSEGILQTVEWDDAWAGIQTRAGLRVTILQLQYLRQSDVEKYARRRNLDAEFTKHLRSLYDLRELVRRFFLLVKLCDLSGQLKREEWMSIRDRNGLYEQLLKTWLVSEQIRNPNKLSLDSGNLLSLLEYSVLHINQWTTNSEDSTLIERLRKTLQEFKKANLSEADAHIMAEALINANIVTEFGFTHSSVEEYLLARVLANSVRFNRDEEIAPARVTNDVISFLVENESFRSWLDQNQDRLSNLNAHCLPHIVRLLHRQGRAIPALNLRGAKLSKLQLQGLRLRGADLRGADFEGTDLGPADLTEADLREGTILQNVSLWTTQRAAEIYSLSDEPDRIWITLPVPNSSIKEAVLVQVGLGYGRILAVQRYDSRTEKLQSDGRSLYRLPRSIPNKNTEVIQWIGKNVIAERWQLLPDAILLTSNDVSGTIWIIKPNQVILCDEEGVVLESFEHRNGSVGGAIGVSSSSDFRQASIDGFCLIGSTLWAVGTNNHFQVCENMPLNQPIQRLVAVGESRIIFKTTSGWCSWSSSSQPILKHPDLAEIVRVVAIPSGGFALLETSKVSFAKETLQIDTPSVSMLPSWRDVVGMRRGNQKAIVALYSDNQWLQIVDEDNGVENPEWIRLRANGTLFDESTKLNNEIAVALVNAGALNTSLTSQPPVLGKSLYRKPALSESPPKTTQPPPYLNLAEPDSRKSVLAVATEWESKYGGLSTFNRNLCIAIKRAGHRVCCLVPKATPTEVEAAKTDGVELVVASPTAEASDRELLLRRPNLPSEFSPQIIIGHDRITGSAAQAHAKDSFPQAQFVLFIHTAPSDIEWYKPRAEDEITATETAEQRRLAQRHIASNANLVAAVGPRLYREIEETLVNLNIQVVQFNPGLGEIERSARPLNAIYCLLLGRAEDDTLKGLDIAARAMGRLTQKKPNPFPIKPELIIRGATPKTGDQLREKLINIGGVGLKVRVKEYTPESERISEDIQRASVVLMPSRSEGFGLVGLEAVTAGIPVLVSSESGLGELLRDKLPAEISSQCVITVTGDIETDSQEWARAIEGVLLNRTAAFSKASEMQELLDKFISWEKSVNELFQILSKAI